MQYPLHKYNTYLHVHLQHKALHESCLAADWSLPRKVMAGLPMARQDAQDALRSSVPGSGDRDQPGTTQKAAASGNKPRISLLSFTKILFIICRCKMM